MESGTAGRCDLWDREYPNFPIPRMVFGVRVLENGKVAECSMGVVADEAPTVDILT